MSQVLTTVFVRDVERMETFMLNGKLISTRAPGDLWAMLLEELGQAGATKASKYLTQACMGDMFVDETTSLREGEMLFCNPKHNVSLTIRNSNSWYIRTTRSFRHVFVTNIGDTWDLDVGRFVVEYDSRFEHEHTSIDYFTEGHEKMGKSIMLEQELSL